MSRVGRLVAGLLIALLTALASSTASAHSAGVFDGDTSIVAFKGQAYFLGGDWRRKGLYRTDGTPAGTKLVARVGEDGDGKGLDGLVVFGDELVFLQSGGDEDSSALWRSDGTRAGTRLAVRAPDRDGDQVHVGRPVVAGGQLYTAVESYVIGSERGLRRVDLGSGRLTPVRYEGTPGTVDNLGLVAETTDGTLYLTIEDGRRASLWRVRGTEPAVKLASPVDTTELAVVGNTLFFHAADATHGNEPWLTDGTPAGTRMIADLSPGTASSESRTALVAGGAAYFMTEHAAADGADANQLHRLLPDGTAARITGPDGSASAPWLFGRGLVATDRTVYASAVPVGAQQPNAVLAITAGQTAARIVPNAPTISAYQPIGTPGAVFYAVGNTLWRLGDEPQVAAPMVTTGLAQVAKDGTQDSIFGIAAIGDTVYFRAPIVAGSDAVLWRSDGTPAGSRPVATPGVVIPATSRVTTAVSGLRDRRAPYRWSVHGTVTAVGADPTTREGLCRGRVTVLAHPLGKSKRAPVARAHARVRWNGAACEYRVALKAPRSRLPGSRGQLAIRGRYVGTDQVTASGKPNRGVVVRYG